MKKFLNILLITLIGISNVWANDQLEKQVEGFYIVAPEQIFAVQKILAVNNVLVNDIKNDFIIFVTKVSTPMKNIEQKSSKNLYIANEIHKIVVKHQK